MSQKRRTRRRTASDQTRWTEARRAPFGLVVKLDDYIERNEFIDRIRRLDCGCVVWDGPSRATGYGLFRYRRKMVSVHRFVYRWTVGKLSSNKVLDHLCLNRACMLPAHLQPVTMIENSRRGPRPLHGAPACRERHRTERREQQRLFFEELAAKKKRTFVIDGARLLGETLSPLHVRVITKNGSPSVVALGIIPTGRDRINWQIKIRPEALTEIESKLAASSHLYVRQDDTPQR